MKSAHSPRDFSRPKNNLPIVAQIYGRPGGSLERACENSGQSQRDGPTASEVKSNTVQTVNALALKM